MAQYIVRRLLQLIPITLGILTLIFSLIHMIPRDPALQIAGAGARPAGVVALQTAPGLDPIRARMIRVSLAEELNQLYMTTAIAKGVTRSKAIFRHALKNALIPVITVLALQFGSLLTGAIITEQIFSWPGLGRLLITSINTRDYPQVQASILVIALTYILVNFISDLLYAAVDPRIKLE